jgi:hypothetical protein
MSGLAEVADEFAGVVDAGVGPALGAWPKRKGILIESNKGTKTQKAASNLLMLSPRDVNRKIVQPTGTARIVYSVNCPVG